MDYGGLPAERKGSMEEMASTLSGGFIKLCEEFRQTRPSQEPDQSLHLELKDFNFRNMGAPAGIPINMRAWTVTSLKWLDAKI